jgi:hypothetical protein
MDDDEILQTEIQLAMDEAHVLLMQDPLDGAATRALIARLRDCVNRAHDAGLTVAQRQLQRASDDLAAKLAGPDYFDQRD